MREENCSVSCVSIEKLKPEEVRTYDFLIFGFPVYGYDMPDFVKSYARKIALPGSRGAIIYCTMGYNAGNALSRAADLFEKEGFIIVDSASFLMPGNDGLLISDRDSSPAEKALNTNFDNLTRINGPTEKLAKRAEEFIEKSNGKGDVRMPERKLIYIFLTPVMKLIFATFEKFFVKKFRADENCIQCGLCERICPSGNIALRDGKVSFGEDCYFCLRCINQCPAEAIQIGQFTEGKFRFEGPMGNYVPAPVEDAEKSEKKQEGI